MLFVVFAVLRRCHKSIAAQKWNILAGFCENRLSRRDRIYLIDIFIQINTVQSWFYKYFLKLSGWPMFSWEFYQYLLSTSNILCYS